MVDPKNKKLGILVGGGPAPGINSVIGAATICARLKNVEVLGIQDGFKWIMTGDIHHVTPLEIEDVSRIHFRGGLSYWNFSSKPHQGTQVFGSGGLFAFAFRCQPIGDHWGG